MARSSVSGIHRIRIQLRRWLSHWNHRASHSPMMLQTLIIGKRGGSMNCCDNCGAPDAGLVGSKYVTPYPDVAPTYNEWQELYLCRDCQENEEVRKHFGLDKF